MDLNNKIDYRKLSIAGVTFLSVGSLLLLVMTLSMLMLWGSDHTKYTQDTPPQISVAGTADVLATPDVAEFSFTAMGQAKTVADAQAQATALSNKAIDYLKKAGIADADIKTDSYTINPQYSTTETTSYGSASAGSMIPVATVAPMSNSVSNSVTRNQTIVGYEVTQSIEVKVKKVDQAGTILGGIGSLGVQNISGLNLTVDNQDALQEQAREKAIADARAKAEVLARDLGVHIVRVLSFQDQGNYYPVAFASKAMDASLGAAPAPQIPVGQNKTTSNVTVTFAIQ